MRLITDCLILIFVTVIAEGVGGLLHSAQAQALSTAKWVNFYFSLLLSIVSYVNAWKGRPKKALKRYLLLILLAAYCFVNQNASAPSTTLPPHMLGPF